MSKPKFEIQLLALNLIIDEPQKNKNEFENFSNMSYFISNASNLRIK